MFESLSKLGEALKNYNKDNDKEDEKSSIEKFKEFNVAKEEYEPTEEQQKIASIEDFPGQTKTGEEILIEEEKQKTEKKELDEKIEDIQKVLNYFGDEKAPTTIKPDTSMMRTPSTDINLKPLDLGNIAQKEYLKGLLPTATNNSQTNRVDILLNQLKRLGLS